MNIKKSILYILAPIMIMYAQATHTQELQQNSNTNSQISINSHSDTIAQNNKQYNEDVWKFIEETFQTVTDQTQRIEFCLQQTEQILNSGKMKFDNQKISKSQLLEEIKAVKEIIQFFAGFYQDTNKVPKDKAIEIGTYLNTAFIEYLLPVIQNNIADINAEKFDAYLEQKLEALTTNLQDPATLPAMIAQNEADLKILITACDNIGLSMFNKVYRFLDTKPVPFYGKSTFATAYDVAYWGAAAAVVYSAGLYWFSKDMSIYGTWKEYVEKPIVDTTTPEEKIANEAKIQEFKEWSEKNITMVNGKPSTLPGVTPPVGMDKLVPVDFTKNKTPETWVENGKTYTRWTVADLPGKSFFGDFKETRRSLMMHDDDSAKKMEKNFGLYSHAHVAASTASDPFVMLVTAGLSYYTLPYLKEAAKAAQKKCNEAINYYAKGDKSPMKGSDDFTKTYFKDMIGGDHLEKLAQELADYLKNPTRYERAGISPATGYLLVGPSQTGKSFFAKALKTLIDEKFADNNEKVKFWNVTADDVRYWQGFANIFAVAKKHSPIILFIDEIDMHNVRRLFPSDNTNAQELLTSMNGVETDPSKKIIVIAATNRPEELDFALKQKGRLGNVITFELPPYECRKAYLEKQLAKRNIAISSDMIDAIAQETDAQTYNMIDDIIRQSLQLATFQTRPVEEADFETTLDREIRKIKPNVTISAKEKELVAIYQAGQAVARHVLETDQQIVKITIDTVDKAIKSKEGLGFVNEQKGQQHENLELLPQNRAKPTRLGFVFTISKINNHELLSDDEQERELMALLSGQVALELVKGKMFNEFGKEDRAKILDALERKISQGTPITHEIRQQALKEKDALYNKAKATLQKHTQFIKMITDELIKNHTIDKKQWATLTANYKA